MITETVLTILLSVMTTAVASITSLSVKNNADSKISAEDMKAAKAAGDISRSKLKESNLNVVSLMIDNVSELREYYVISKRQANRSFTSTLFICFLGFIVFVAGIIAAAVTGQEIAVYTTISGCVIEVIAGLFFWLYKNAAEQLNVYHERLGCTEKYLIAMQLAEKMSPEKKDETYKYLIEAILENTSVKQPTIQNSDE